MPTQEKVGVGRGELMQEAMLHRLEQDQAPHSLRAQPDVLGIVAVERGIAFAVMPADIRGAGKGGGNRLFVEPEGEQHPVMQIGHQPGGKGLAGILGGEVAVELGPPADRVFQYPREFEAALVAGGGFFPALFHLPDAAGEILRGGPDFPLRHFFLRQVNDPPHQQADRQDGHDQSPQQPDRGLVQEGIRGAPPWPHQSFLPAHLSNTMGSSFTRCSAGLSLAAL